MKSQLRIGSLVTDEFYDSFKTVIVVESLNDKGINLEVANSDDYPEMQTHWIEPYYEFDKLRGIPLTVEWLLKLGFTPYVHNNRRFSKGPLAILLKSSSIRDPFDGNVWINGSWVAGRTIEYVHQLQNLYFALTGEELKASE